MGWVIETQFFRMSKAASMICGHWQSHFEILERKFSLNDIWVPIELKCKLLVAFVVGIPSKMHSQWENSKWSEFELKWVDLSLIYVTIESIITLLVAFLAKHTLLVNILLTIRLFFIHFTHNSLWIRLMAIECHTLSAILPTLTSNWVNYVLNFWAINNFSLIMQ